MTVGTQSLILFIHTSSISLCEAFWRSFFTSNWVVNWIDCAYYLVWDKLSPTAREMMNSKFSLDNHDFVTIAVAEMMKACYVSVLPSGVLPIIISPLGLVPKPISDKLRLVVNMNYVNEHLARRVFRIRKPIRSIRHD